MKNLGKIEINLDPAKSDGVNICSSIYVWAYLSAFMGFGLCFANMVVVNSPVLHREFAVNSVCLWLPFVYFVMAMDYSAWDLFQSPLAKTILPLPLPNDGMLSVFRKSGEVGITVFRLIFTLLITILLGVHSSSVLRGILVFFYVFSLLALLDSLAVLAVIKTFRVFLKMRLWILLGACVSFFVFSLLFEKISPLSANGREFVTAIASFNLIPLNQPFYIWLALIPGWLCFAGISRRKESGVWNRNIKREELLSAAFPHVTASKSKRSTTLFDLCSRDSRISRRIVFLFQHSFGSIRVNRLLLAGALAMSLPLLLQLFPWRNVFIFLLPAMLGVAIFNIIPTLGINSKRITWGASYAMPIGLVESRMVTILTFVGVFAVSALENIVFAVALGKCNGFAMPLLSLVTLILLGSTFMVAVTGLSFLSPKKEKLKEFCVVSTLQALTCFFALVFFMASIVLSKSGSNIIDVLPIGFKYACVMIVSFVTSPNFANIGDLVLSALRIAKGLDTAMFAASAWTLFLSTCAFTWYYFIRYGRGLTPRLRASGFAGLCFAEEIAKKNQ